MNNDILTVEELKPATVPMIVKYWLESDAKYLMSLGVDLKKLPSGEKKRVNAVDAFLAGGRIGFVCNLISVKPDIEMQRPRVLAAFDSTLARK